MPQTGYWPQWYTTTATTTNQYIPLYQYQNTTAVSPNTIWQTWINNSYTTTPTITTQNNYTNQVWIEWNQTPLYTPRVLTPEETAEMEARERRQREIYEQRNRQRVAARARARTLLEDFLSDDQKAELNAHGRFYVVGSRGRRYCIRAEGQSGNVDLLKADGSVQARLCAHPRDGLPEGDAWLMQMIEIRHDEDHFLRTANVHAGRLPALV